MKSVLISIQPKWCELIASGKKTVEVRKTRPKMKTPFKCYIYCTKPRHYFHISKHLLTSDESLFLINGKVRMCDGFGVEYEDSEYKHLNCKVIGEFVCDRIRCEKELTYGLVDIVLEKNSCLSASEIGEYANGKVLYSWHISDLVIYDKPRELGEFKKINRDCWYADLGLAKRDCEECRNAECMITRPPQSWCYVESEG